MSAVRERRRAETVREIKESAVARLAEVGPGALSLRAVARDVGMTVQSLYHYFDSRDALLTALMADAHHALADAVQAAADASRGAPPADRRRSATAAFREWALAHSAEFLLLYGSPVPDFAPLPGNETGAAALRLAAPFAEVVFDGWTPAELAALPLAPGAEAIAGVDLPAIPLPPGALAFFLELRARMHGLVVLELLGHLHPLQDVAGALFSGAMHHMTIEIDERQARAADQPRSAR
ncbi:TetR/AcrR family transcriptional regulator [Pseudonocardia abyssalis]|uniref:TetR/AcrR family transcriptional regulator n=1 Tax=Pseudonocardia abyssalis TaxID=2792008 RepID=A0ABS6UT04_9PSEU|nr:TetR/AcrR family transcriptional regulator [Pseudonocardia abyssalis]MBW0119135.1 TetR/AcrR family transcriptional regulator [Pseudonocardia abyssalis]MBW0135357.1 TetR/AcrR family transcriptional regulator [Pseudonocardia abyssalis]